MDKLLVLLVCLLPSVISEETYANSSNVCEKCKCTDEAEFILDCRNQSFYHVLANWPPHDKTLIATFSYNNITTLEILPITEQKTKLVFDHCNIRYLDQGVFSHVRNVDFIDLSYNLLTTEEIDGQDFKGPYNKSEFYPIAVRHLNLAYNQIHSLPRKFFENMPHLEELNLAGNDFTVLDPNTQMALSTLSKLRILNLADNELTELVAEAISSLKTLEELDLSSNHLDFVPQSLEYVSKSLKVLKLSDNYIFELDDKSFLGLHLVELHLDHLPRLNVIKPNTFATLQQLKKLSLSNNRNLKAIDKQAFNEKQILVELLLNNNSLTEISFQLLSWSRLKVFEIKDNPLECSCDLYNITNALDVAITRSLNGPNCIDIIDGTSKQMYSLKGDMCQYEGQPYHIYHAARHFEVVRSVIITLSLLLTLGTIVAMIVAFLRYRKGVAFRSYPFTAQVAYLPVTTHYRI